MRTMRYDVETQIYRDCPWCHGKGCLACPEEADKEYKRQFPDGPKPIATFPNTPEGKAAAFELINRLASGIDDEGKEK